MGGSPVLWCEVADFLAFHSALSHREAERYVEVLRAHDYCSAQDALQQIPVWHAQGVTPELLSVGDSRPFEIGWIRNDAALPGLLRAIADEIEREQHTTHAHPGPLVRLAQPRRARAARPLDRHGPAGRARRRARRVLLGVRGQQRRAPRSALRPASPTRIAERSPA